MKVVAILMITLLVGLALAYDGVDDRIEEREENESEEDDVSKDFEIVDYEEKGPCHTNTYWRNFCCTEGKRYQVWEKKCNHKVTESKRIKSKSCRCRRHYGK